MELQFSDIPIITYHKISTRREWGLNTVPPNRFREQLLFLKDSGFNPINFKQLLSNDLPPKPIIITFDDGYDSVYECALPVLKEFKFTGVIFVITNFIGEWNTWDANLGGIRFRHLDERQITQLAEYGMELASHGVTHRAFTHLNDDEIRAEMEISQQWLADLTGQSVVTLAYPFGIQNGRVQQIARETGYKFGCTNLWGVKNNNNLLCLSRIAIYRLDSLSAFRRKLISGWQHRIEISKLQALSWPARLTPIFQKYIKRISPTILTENGRKI